jgi:Ca2+-binding EF-hand superfamily protein
MVEFHDGDVWDRVSHEAKAFIRRLVNRDPDARPTAKQALDDPWFKMTKCDSVSLHDQIGPRLAKFQQMKRFKKMVALVVAAKMTEHLKEYTPVSAEAARHNIEQLHLNEQLKEITELQKVFQHIDASGDGLISLDELRHALDEHEVHSRTGFFSAWLSQRPQAQPDGEHRWSWSINVDELFDGVDLDGQHAINFTEFVAATLTRRWLLEPSLLKEAFDYFDRDHSGVITRDNLVELLKSEAAVDALIEEMSLEEAAITFDQFCDIMKSPNFKSLLSTPATSPATSRSNSSDRYSESDLLAVANHWLDLEEEARVLHSCTLVRAAGKPLGFRLSEVLSPRRARWPNPQRRVGAGYGSQLQGHHCSECVGRELGLRGWTSPVECAV